MGIATLANEATGKCMAFDNAVHLGNAPTLLSLKQLQKTAPTWMNTSMAIFDDAEANKVGPFPLTDTYFWLCTCATAALECIDLLMSIMYSRNG